MQAVSRAWALIGVVVSAVCACSVGFHASEFRPFDVFITLQIDRSIVRQVHSRDLEEEAESVWAPYGVRLNWIDHTWNEAADSFSLQATVGRQIVAPRLPEWVSVLGKTTVSLGRPSHLPILLSFDATEKLLDVRRTTGASSVRVVRELEMARALGRVLAHEIGHVLLAAPYHDGAGLMRPSFAPTDLAAPAREPFRLTCNSVERLRSRMRVLSGGEAAADASIDGGLFDVAASSRPEDSRCIDGTAGRYRTTSK